MDAVLVRPVFPGDHLALAALLASADMHPMGMVSSRDCCVATLGSPERVIGYGAWWHVRLDKFRMDLLVAEEWRRQGVGSHLLSHVVSQARAAGAVTLQARVDGGHQGSLAFLVAHGFAETMRMHTLVLDVAEVDLAAHEHILTRVAAQGVVVTVAGAGADAGRCLLDRVLPAVQRGPSGLARPRSGP
jgi:GNAT superfamily N-acetyltransferase